VFVLAWWVIYASLGVVMVTAYSGFFVGGVYLLWGIWWGVLVVGGFLSWDRV
jgi:hypothetical protein